MYTRAREDFWNVKFKKLFLAGERSEKGIDSLRRRNLGYQSRCEERHQIKIIQRFFQYRLLIFFKCMNKYIVANCSF